MANEENDEKWITWQEGDDPENPDELENDYQ